MTAGAAFWKVECVLKAEKIFENRGLLDVGAILEKGLMKTWVVESVVRRFFRKGGKQVQCYESAR